MTDFTQSELNHLVSVIHQNVFLFNADIYTNICLGESFLEEELEAALENSGVNQFLPGLSQGIYSPVGENGSLLSGGQRQRVAIGRATDRVPKALLMHEPPSNLDAKLPNQMGAEIIQLLSLIHH